MPLSVDESYLRFNDILHNIYQSKAKLSISLVIAKDIKNHNKKFSQLLSDNMSSGMPNNLIDGWLELFFKNLADIKPESYGGLRGDIDAKINAAFEIYRQYFDTYQEHFLPLREKEMLEHSVASLDHKEKHKI